MAIATIKELMANSSTGVGGRRPVKAASAVASGKGRGLRRTTARGCLNGGCGAALGRVWASSADLEMRGNEACFGTFFQQKIGRRVQLVTKLVAVIGMVFTIMNVTLDYSESPTLTTLESDSYPARDVDFPGVAVCSTNKMSRRAVDDLAEELYSLNTVRILNVSLHKIKDILKHLGHLYMFDIHEDEYNDAQFLHAILTLAYGDYNIDQLMMQLTPKCRSILKYCSWEGKDRICDNMFFLRKTQDGFCCTFNYARRNDDFGSTKRSGFVSSLVEKSSVISPEYGLTVVLNSAVNDCYYKSTPSNGFKVLVHESLDYPDAPSGSLREILVPEKSEVFISMDATSFHTVPEVLKFDVSSRNCLFNTEQNKIFQGYYSYSDCIMYCRIRDILRLCSCIPFFYPQPDDIDSPRSCGLEDLYCLKSYRTKWSQVQPRLKKKSTFDDNAYVNDPSSHLSCNCFPSCDDVTYKVSSSKIPLTAKELLWDRNMVPNRNYSLLHVYFDGPNTIRLKQDVLYYWYELMSDYGGVCSLFLGISIINVIEIIYAFFNLMLKRESGDASLNNAAINRVEDKPVMRQQRDADDCAKLGTKTSKRLAQDARVGTRLNAVKVIDIGPTAVHRITDWRPPPQPLYWQELAKTLK